MAEIFQLKVEDFDRDLLGQKKELEGTELIIRILDYFRNLHHSIMDKIQISASEDDITILYSPNGLEEKDQEKFSRAIALLSEKKLNLGKEYLLQLVEKYPLNGDILYNLGMSYSELGEFEKSIKPLEKATEVVPFFSNAYVALGFSYANMKRYEEAVKYNKLALMYDKNNFYASRNIAGCLSNLGKFNEAKKFAEKALELEPDDPQALLGYALISKSLGDIDSYSKYLKKIVENGINERMVNYAKNELGKLAETDFKSKGYRLDAVMYLIDAIKLYQGLQKDDIQILVFSAARMGMNGFDINSPDKKYYFKELDKECSGLQMVCFMYAGFQIIDPSINIGMDLSKEYNAAKGMMNE